MDNVKKFEDFLDRMQGLLDNAKKQGHIIVRVEDLENTFPELTESEDERIRKELIDFVKSRLAGFPQCEKYTGWLERQGTPAKLSEEEQNRFAKGVLTSCALSFIDYLDAHKYEGKMCVSNGECEDIENAFHNAMWDRLHRYYCKYIEKQGENKPAEEYNITGIRSKHAEGKLGEMIKRKLEMEKQNPADEVGNYDHKKVLQTIINKQKPVTIDIDKMVNDYANNKERGNEEFGKPVGCMIRAYRQGLIDVIGKVVLKPAWSEEDERMYKGLHNLIYSTPYCDSRKKLSDFLNSLKNRVQPKSAEWSDEDENRLSSVLFLLHEYKNYNFDKWLKSLKDRVQPKQEWSALDERNLQGVIDEIQANKNNAPDYDLETYDRFLSWLKSLKDRYTWKPSDEQMEMVDKIINVLSKMQLFGGRNALIDLKHDLEKLREE